MNSVEYNVLVTLSRDIGGLVEAVDKLQLDMADIKAEVQALSATKHRVWGALGAAGLLTGAVGSLLPGWILGR